MDDFELFQMIEMATGLFNESYTFFTRIISGSHLAASRHIGAQAICLWVFLHVLRLSMKRGQFILYALETSTISSSEVSSFNFY